MNNAISMAGRGGESPIIVVPMPNTLESDNDGAIIVSDEEKLRIIKCIFGEDCTLDTIWQNMNKIKGKIVLLDDFAVNMSGDVCKLHGYQIYVEMYEGGEAYSVEAVCGSRYFSIADY